MLKSHAGAFRRLAVVLAVVTFAAGCDVTDWEVGGAEREAYCDPTDTEINDGHGDGHHGGHHFPYTEPKGPLSMTECLALDLHLTNAVEFAQQFPTAGDAEDAGWYRLAPWIPGQGTHHLDSNYGIPTSFDWSRPTMLMYDSNSRSGALTGMVWAVNTGAGNPPPEGFHGDNDHWHAHERLCYRNGTIIGDNISDAECESRGGTNVNSSGIWLVHVWLPEYAGWEATDIFNKEHPFVG